MEKLSVVLITFNEEENVRNCLESIKWADEIVVVDSFSSDRTVEIAKEYTSKVFQERWQGYGRQKNFALLNTTYNWVLWIDADEIVTEKLQKEIASAIENKSFDGFFIPRKNFFCGRWIKYGGWYPDYTLRLFKKEKASFEEREVHEKVILNGKTSYLSSPLLHYTYKNLDEYIERQNIYSSLSAKELFKKNSDRKISPFFPALKFILKFFETYIYKRGFLDGYYGLLLSISASYFTLLKYSKLKELQNKKYL